MVKNRCWVRIQPTTTNNCRSEMIANGFLERFLLGLRSARSVAYQQYLYNYQECKRNPINV